MRGAAVCQNHQGLTMRPKGFVVAWPMMPEAYSKIPSHNAVHLMDLMDLNSDLLKTLLSGAAIGVSILSAYFARLAFRQANRPIVAAFVKYLTGTRATTSFRQRGMLLRKEEWSATPGP